MPDEPTNTKNERTGGENISWFLLPLAASQIFYGIEFGIRNVLINPFVLYELNDGNYVLFSLKVFSQVASGFAGNFFYNNWICNQKTRKDEYYLILSLMIYALFDFVASLTASYGIWMFFQSLAIFSMGWYFPMLETMITNNLPSRWLGLGHSLKSAIYTCSGGLFLIFVYKDMSLDNIRVWFQVAALALALSAVTIYICVLVKKNLNIYVNNKGVLHD